MQALDLNARERARRFVTTSKRHDLKNLHEAVKKRSVSLFEPRPELNHATNSLCIVGRRALTKELFLDRRAFLNSMIIRSILKVIIYLRFFRLLHMRWYQSGVLLFSCG